MRPEDLRSSNQRALVGMAREILERPVGDRLGATTVYQEQFKVGAGTLQKALRLIESIGAAQLRSAGHQGTFLEAKDIGLLWNLAGLGQVRITLSPPGAVEFYALGDAVGAAFERLQVPLAQHYESGAANRIAAVRDGRSDVAIVSAGAAANLAAGDEFRTWNVGPGTYYGDDTLSVVTLGRDRASIAHQARIGIDLDSSDHDRLTRTEFPESDGYTYVDCTFQQIPAAVLAGKIDAGIWHRMASIIPLELCGLTVEPLSAPAALAVVKEISGAVLVTATAQRATTAAVDSISVRSVRQDLRSIVARNRGTDAGVWLR